MLLRTVRAGPHAWGPRILGRVIVAIDVGNTKISLGVIKGGDVASARRASTHSLARADDAERVLGELLAHDDAKLSDISEAWLVSVVPVATDAITEVCQRHSISLTVASAANVPMATRVNSPADVGADRLVGAFAASLLYGAPAIVVDLGTATTLDVVAPDGAFLGGAIAPGLGLGLEALAERTAQLPRVPIEVPERAIGQDTVSAIQSGAVLGYFGLVKELVRRITAELGTKPTVVVTGGLSALPWASNIPGVAAIDPLLTLRGLALLKREMMALPKIAHAEP
jgi:type III pantothenate kinase